MATLIRCGSEKKIIEFIELEFITDSIIETPCSLKNIKEILETSLKNSERSVYILSNSLLQAWFNEVRNCEQPLIDSVFYNFPELNLYNVLASQKILSKLLDSDIKLEKIENYYFYIMKKLEFPELSSQIKKLETIN